MPRFQSRSGREVIVEYIQQGAYMKVSAVDARTGFEVSIVGDAKQTQSLLQAAAIRKLEYVLEKRRKQRRAIMQQNQRMRTPGSTSGWDL